MAWSLDLDEEKLWQQEPEVLNALLSDRTPTMTMSDEQDS